MAVNYADSPYYRVITRTSQRDLTPYIDNITFTDEVGSNDVLDITIKGIPVNLIDDKDFGEGTIILFSFGYIKGKYSGNRIARLTNISYSYGKIVNIKIKALDLGIILKKGKLNFTWQDVSIAELANKIAKKNGLKLDIDPKIGGVDKLANKIKFLPQVNETDFDTLKKALQVGGTGDFIVYSTDDKIIIKNRGLGKKSKRTFTWNSPNDTVINFSPSVKDTSKSEFSAKTEVVGIDPFTGEELSVTSDSETTSGEVKLGDKPLHYDVNGTERKNQVAGLVGDKPPVSQKLVVPVDEDQNLDVKATSTKVEASQTDVTATLKIKGDPNLFSDDIITMAGVAAKHSGNWYIEKSVHAITNSGYVTTLSLNKNAANRTSIENAPTLTDTNETQGDKETDTKKTVEVYNYDVNGIKKDSEKSKSIS